MVWRRVGVHPNRQAGSYQRPSREGRSGSGEQGRSQGHRPVDLRPRSRCPPGIGDFTRASARAGDWCRASAGGPAV